MIHALGFVAHLESPDSIMTRQSDFFWADNPTPIYFIDRETLTAAYTKLESLDTPTEIYKKLGDWTATSTHLMGENEFAQFGVVHRNGFVQGWARGQAPRTYLVSSPLRGTVTWNGDLLGFTPTAASVTGDAEISVRLSTLRGHALFDELENWTAGQHPGRAGSGRRWGDGDLYYSIAVRNNTFRETGGDEGTLTGVFVGPTHEGAIGTVERDDLTAAFGAVR